MLKVQSVDSLTWNITYPGETVSYISTKRIIIAPFLDEIGLIDQNHWGNRGSSGIVDRSCIATFKLNDELHYIT